MCLHVPSTHDDGMTTTPQAAATASKNMPLPDGDEERVVQRGDFYCIPADVPHSDTALGDEPFVMLDIFCPIREDFVARCETAPPANG